MENSLEIKEKKNLYKFCTKMPQGPAGQEFWPECNFGVFEQKIVDSIYSGPGNNWKIL